MLNDVSENVKNVKNKLMKHNFVQQWRTKKNKEQSTKHITIGIPIPNHVH